jgi:hypothetical protein
MGRGRRGPGSNSTECAGHKLIGHKRTVLGVCVALRRFIHHCGLHYPWRQRRRQSQRRNARYLEDRKMHLSRIGFQRNMPGRSSDRGVQGLCYNLRKRSIHWLDVALQSSHQGTHSQADEASYSSTHQKEDSTTNQASDQSSNQTPNQGSNQSSNQGSYFCAVFEPLEVAVACANFCTFQGAVGKALEFAVDIAIPGSVGKALGVAVDSSISGSVDSAFESSN